MRSLVNTLVCGPTLHCKSVLRTYIKGVVGEGASDAVISLFFLHISPPPHPGSADLSAPRRLEAPVFIEPLQDCCVDEGNDVTLRGVLAGSQPIKVSWLHNGELGRFTLGQHCFVVVVF